MTGSINKIRTLRDQGTAILQALIDGPDAIDREQGWRDDLLAALRQWGAAVVGMFEPLGTITPDEDAWATKYTETADSQGREHATPRAAAPPIARSGSLSHSSTGWSVQISDPQDRKYYDSIYCHAVRMFRLNEFFAKLADAAPLTPATSPGPDKDPRYVAIAVETLRIMTAKGYTKRAPALRDAIADAAEAEKITADEAGSAFETISRRYF